MPFWLTNAPAVFQALVYVLWDILNKFLFVYTDEIQFFLETEEEHIWHVNLVLRQLLENSFFVKSEKYEFHVCSIQLVGTLGRAGKLSR